MQRAIGRKRLIVSPFIIDDFSDASLKGKVKFHSHSLRSLLLKVFEL